MTKKHIYRAPLPWRETELTECGRIALPDQTVPITMVQFTRDAGTIVASDEFCNTCVDRAAAYWFWDPVHHRLRDDQIRTVRREIERSWTGEERTRLDRELSAIRVLVQEHQAHFKHLLALEPEFLDYLDDVQEFETYRRSLTSRNERDSR